MMPWAILWRRRRHWDASARSWRMRVTPWPESGSPSAAPVCDCSWRRRTFGRQWRLPWGGCHCRMRGVDLERSCQRVSLLTALGLWWGCVSPDRPWEKCSRHLQRLAWKCNPEFRVFRCVSPQGVKFLGCRRDPPFFPEKMCWMVSQCLILMSRCWVFVS